MAAVVRSNHYLLCEVYNSCIHGDIDMLEGTLYARMGVFVGSKEAQKMANASRLQ